MFFPTVIWPSIYSSFLEGDEDEDTCTISQEDIADAVDITAGAKVGRRTSLQPSECHVMCSIERQLINVADGTVTLPSKIP